MSDGLSVIAISVSLFTFYWSFFKNIEKFYFIRIDSSVPFGLKNVFLNAGNSDILISEIKFGISNKVGNSYPIHNINYKGNKKFIVEPKKSISIEPNFKNNDAISKRDILHGKVVEINKNKKEYHLDLIVSITWIDSSANEHINDINVITYLYDDKCLYIGKRINRKNKKLNLFKEINRII